MPLICMGSAGDAKVRARSLWRSDTSNKPLERSGHHQQSASPPQAPCLPLRGSVRRNADPPGGYVSARRFTMPEVGRPSSIVNLREQVVVGPVNHGYVLVVADQSQCKTGFRVISATALSVAHGKDRPMRGGSQNRPNDKSGHDPYGRAGRSFVNRLSLFLIKKGDFRWPK
jgi:hypothetical protein